MTDGHSRALDALLQAARRDADILAVILFGSAARREQHAGSDLDVCLVLAPDRTAGDRDAAARKRLAYAQAFPFDVQVFQALPLYIRRRVLREGRVLLVKDEPRLYDLAYRTAQAYGDFRRAYEEYLAQVSRG
jgi:predicted nucleotidyltransferase